MSVLVLVRGLSGQGAHRACLFAGWCCSCLGASTLDLQALLRQITFSLFLDLFSISPQVSSLGLRSTNVSHKLALNLPLYLCLSHITLRLLTSARLPQASFPLPFLISWNLLLWLLLFRHLSSWPLTLLLASSVVNSTMIWAVHASQVEYTSLSDASFFLLPECGSCLASPEDLAVLTLETYKHWLVSLAHLLLKAAVSLKLGSSGFQSFKLHHGDVRGDQKSASPFPQSLESRGCVCVCMCVCARAQHMCSHVQYSECLTGKPSSCELSEMRMCTGRPVTQSGSHVRCAVVCVHRLQVAVLVCTLLYRMQ